ncbi:MAG TPA: hypothetical protein VMG14_06545 [Thermoplasmata archaeon]|nr:hypothetical protein [Thermoplasmata archaeon]HTW77406.1 hypothetical protein [Thermoplasmata archaeon]
MAEGTEEVSRGLMEGVIEALSDKQSQMEIRLDGLTLALGDTRLGVHLSGTVTVSIHLRDLTDAEKEAHAAATVARVHA